MFDQKKLISLSSNFVCLWKTSCLKVKKGLGIYADYFIFDTKISQQGRGSLNSAEYVSRTIWMDPKTKIKKTQQYKPRKETRSCGSFFFSFFVAEQKTAFENYLKRTREKNIKLIVFPSFSDL